MNQGTPITDLNILKQNYEKLSAESGLLVVHGTINNNSQITIDVDRGESWPEILKYVSSTESPFLFIEFEAIDESDLLQATADGSDAFKNVKIGDIMSLRVGVVVGQVFIQQRLFSEWSSELIFDKS